MTLSVQVLQRLLAYAYTFNDPLSIHFSLVPVLQVPTITSLAYFSTSPRLCLLSYSVIIVYAFNPNYNLLQLLLLIPVYVVVLLLAQPQLHLLLRQLPLLIYVVILLLLILT